MESESFSSYNISLVVDKGYVYKNSWLSKNIYTTLRPEEKDKGQFVFEILENTNPIKIVFNTEIIGGKVIEISLS